MSDSSSAYSLDQIERWMQSVITHPRGVHAGVNSSPSRQQIDVSTDQIDEVILPGPAQSPLERLAVYGNAYYARLLGVLRELFPALSHALGEDLFSAFAFDYLQRYPSQSYTLGRLADCFVRFLEETRPTAPPPEADAAGPMPVSWPDFIIDLARLEWTIDEVFDAPGVENEPLLDPSHLARIPAARWPEARLVPVVCLRLLSFKYPVNDYYTEFRQGKAPPLPEPRTTFAALLRRDYIVRRFELSAAQHELLSALVDGETLGNAVMRCARHDDDVERLSSQLQAWFRLWAAEGFFQSVHVSTDCSLEGEL